MFKFRRFAALFAVACLAGCGSISPTANEDPPAICYDADGEPVECFGTIGSGN